MSFGQTSIRSAQADEQVIRIIAFFALFITAWSVYFDNHFLSFFLAADFGIRAFLQPAFSPLRLAAKGVSVAFGIRKKPVYAAPKKFAAAIGFLCCLLIAGGQAAGYPLLSWTVGAVLILCAYLESAFGVCVGCYVYSFLTTIKSKTTTIKNKNHVNQIRR